jgi:uncharacterized protein YqeY
VAETLKSRLQTDLNRARKDRDKARTLVLSTTISELKNRELENGRDATDEDVVTVLTRAIKQRREASEQMRGGGRAELAAKEEAEAGILQGYLPEALSEVEVRALVREAIAGGATQMGAVMGKLMPRIKGRFDGKEANRIVTEELSR